MNGNESEQHQMKTDNSLFAVLSEVCIVYAPPATTTPATTTPAATGDNTKRQKKVVGSLASFEENDIMKRLSNSVVVGNGGDATAINEPLNIHDQTTDGDLRDAFLISNTPRTTTTDEDTLDVSISTVSDNVPAELTHISLDEDHLQQLDNHTTHTFDDDSSAGPLHITTESILDGRSGDSTEDINGTNNSNRDDSLDELNLSATNAFDSSTPRTVDEKSKSTPSTSTTKSVVVVSKEKTVFEEIVETRTEIVEESTYEVESDFASLLTEKTGSQPAIKGKETDHLQQTKESVTENVQQSLLKGNESVEPVIVKDLVNPTKTDNDSDKQSSPPELDESTISLAEGDVMDTTIDLREAVIGEQSEPLNVAKALLDGAGNKTPVKKRKENIGRSNSWKFSNDYKLSRSSQSLIESIESDMEDETMNNMDPDVEDKVHENVQEMLEVRAHLRHIGDDGDNSTSKKPPQPLQRHFSLENNLKTNPPSLSSAPVTRKNKSKDKGRSWKSKSLHNIFTGDDLETDIDTVDDKELMDVLRR